MRGAMFRRSSVAGPSGASLERRGLSAAAAACLLLLGVDPLTPRLKLPARFVGEAKEDGATEAAAEPNSNRRACMEGDLSRGCGCGCFDDCGRCCCACKA